MRVPSSQQQQLHQLSARRRSAWILALLVAIVAALVLLDGFSNFYANYLWFHWAGVGEVWGTITATKVVLGAVFVAIAFLLCYVSLFLVDTIAPRALFMAPDSELVRRYQAVAGPHAAALRAGVSFLVALLLGVGASSQWRHWMLFEHAVPFGRVDPLFNLDDSFFVFRLPFLSFLVNWLLLALLVVFVVSVAGHFLNGAIRLQSSSHIEPRALAHLSLLLGAMALVRAWGYYFVDRYLLELSSNGVVAGADYTDVHVRLPALTLLAVVSLAAFVLLVFNAYQRSLVLPLVALGLWGLLALTLEVIYPAAVQAFRVTPSQGTLELPYIKRNISATQYAMGINAVTTRRFPANEDLTPGVLAQYRASLQDAQLWDPTFAQSAFNQLQDGWSYFKLSKLATDRYVLHGRLTPVDIGVRELNASRLASRSWVNTHLVFTHGYGAVLAPANSSSPNGNPEFKLGFLPPTSSDGLPKLSQPAVYFAPGESGYFVVDSKLREVDYQDPGTAATRSSRYRGSGGVPIGSFWSRLAFAVQLKDFNLLVSKLVTPHSRLVTVPDIRQRAQKALPFLTVDENPYPVIDHGHIDWVVDAYTTSSSFPDAQPAKTETLPSSSPLAGKYNYIRDAVKVVVNAYTGKMHFYVLDPSDPIIQAWEDAFPGMFQPASAMGPTLKVHLRYPQELLQVQAAMYGAYHVSQPSQFYSGADAWQISETSTSRSGSPRQPLPRGADGQVATYRPIYELLQLPGEHKPSFEAVEPMVPYSATGQLQTLSAVLFANSAFGRHYGVLEALVTPRGGIEGPGLANAQIMHNPIISARLSQLDQGGSVVMLGNVQTLPIADSLLYVRPLYVSSSQTNFPELVDVIMVYGKQIVMEPTLSQALKDVFGTGVGVSTTGPTATSPGPTQSVPASIKRLLSDAARDYRAAGKALAQGNLGTYQSDMTKAGIAIEKAKRLLDSTAASTATSATTRISTRSALRTRAVPLPKSASASTAVASRTSTTRHRLASKQGTATTSLVHHLARGGIVATPAVPTWGGEPTGTVPASLRRPDAP